MRKLITLFTTITLHLIAIGVIVTVFYPMAKWYFDASPIWGVDFYYTASMVRLLRSNFTFPPMSWNYAWFAGWPNFSFFPMLHYYFILPLTYVFDLLSAVKLWMIVSLGLFVAGVYACSYILSRNRGLAMILAIASIYSVSVYGSLMWGGSLPNFATQAFFPWTLFFIILNLKSGKLSPVLIGACCAGLSMLGHPQIAIAYIFPSSAILFLFSFGNSKIGKRIINNLIFVTIAVVVGLPVIYSSTDALKYLLVTNATDVASSTAKIDEDAREDIQAFHLAQPKRIFTDNNKTFFIFLPLAAFIWLVSLIFRHRRQVFLDSLPYVILAVFYTVYIYIFAYGISIYHGGWYRLFWSVPVWTALLISVWWGVGESTFKEKFTRFGNIVSLILTIIALALGYYLLPHYSQGIKEQIVLRSNPSSAFPDVLNLRTDAKGRELLKKEMVPNWLNADATDYRMYDGDQTVNIWWNSLYKMPLARGYFDPPSAQARGYRFWVDAALSVDTATGDDQLVGSFNYPEEIAANNTQYLIDWYSIKYFEGGRGGPTTYAPLPKSLSSNGFIKNETELDFNREKYNTGGQTLKFYEFQDNSVGPILYSTNSPTLGVIATDEAYETIVRVLADANLGSKVIIPVKLGPEIDAINSYDLHSFDAIVLYNYKYRKKEKAFLLVADYVKKGGKLFIETGTEVPESAATDLPEIFPVSTTVRKSLGSAWDIKSESESLASGVDFSVFSPLLFDEAEWNLSFPPNETDLRSTVKVILKHSGYPVMIEKQLGKGQVIWSGINLPYHVSRYHNAAEIVYFTNVIKSLLPPEDTDSSGPDSYVQFISAQKRMLTTTGAKGVLFKEENYPGWQATVKNGNILKSQKIWSAGPAYPGFMYISIPKDMVASRSTVTITYLGTSISWFFSIISMITIIYIGEHVIFRGIVLGKSTHFLMRSIQKRLKRWWVKEDEE